MAMAEKTVANHILEATKKGLLVKDPTTGYRGRAAAYQATFPAGQRAPVEGPVSLRSLVGSTVKVPGNGEPFSPGIRESFEGPEGAKVPGNGEAQRAPAHTRAPSRTHGTKPTPRGSRAVGEADPGSTDGSNEGEWMPTPLKCPSSDSQREAG